MVKNNTDAPAYDLTAAVTATDASRTEVTTSMAHPLQPHVVAPGGLAIGTLMITDDALDGMEGITVEISAAPEPNEDDVELQPGNTADISIDPGFYVQECPTQLLAASGTTVNFG